MSIGQQILGGMADQRHDPDSPTRAVVPPPKPNRAQRRAAQQARAAQQRRGQRAYNRTTQELDFGPAPTRQQRRRGQA